MSARVNRSIQFNVHTYMQLLHQRSHKSETNIKTSFESMAITAYYCLPRTTGTNKDKPQQM